MSDIPGKGNLMDRKRNILVREMMGLIGEAEELQSEIDSTFTEAYRSLRKANITLGIIDDIASSIPVDDSVEIRYRSIMGVEIPNVAGDAGSPGMYYGFQGTNSALDDAYIKFHRVKDLCRRLADTENRIYILAASIKKTQKRANSLERIVIPRLTAEIESITGALEEKDREEFTRLKVIKRSRLKR